MSHVGPQLTFIGESRFSQSQINKNNSNARYDNTRSGDNDHPEGPFGHLPLGLKIALAAPLFAIGFGIACCPVVVDSGPVGQFLLRVFLLLTGSVVGSFAIMLLIYQPPPKCDKDG